MKLTPKQRQALELIRESGASGICIRYVWTFQIDGEVITRQVNALRKKGFVSMIAFTGGRSAVNITEAGKVALSGR